MSVENLLNFSEIVFADKKLQSELLEIDDRNEFIGKVIELGKAHNFEFSREEAEEIMRNFQRAWIERWI